jgi:hypothetical protein
MFTFSRIHWIRFLVVRWSKKTVELNLAQELAPPSAQQDSVFEDLVPDRVIEVLKNDGLHLGVTIPPSLLEEILDFAQTAIYQGDGKEQFPFTLANRKAQEIKFGKGFRLGYNFEPASQCAAIKKLATDQKLWEIAAKYFGALPMLASTQIWWTFVQDSPGLGREAGFYRFHYDLEDYACVKFMFYLTDVSLADGAHVCVKGSHRNKKLSHQFSLLRERDDQEIEAYYGQEKVIKICDRAGVGFAEDPFCFHKGIVPQVRDRLILEFKFTINNYGMIL